ncbi:MAG: tetratricopeptide repeat protein [Cyanobacteria bacterium]|nr:tetratricopeptide repeat protein [Cyanobacteriota bacterium]
MNLLFKRSLLISGTLIFLITPAVFAPVVFAGETLISSNLDATVSLPGATEQAIRAYREGNYPQAIGLLEQDRVSQPKDPKILYYLAISHAALGHDAEAAVLYHLVIQADPTSSEAALAQEGIQYLPPELQNGATQNVASMAHIDHPPKNISPRSIASVSSYKNAEKAPDNDLESSQGITPAQVQGKAPAIAEQKPAQAQTQAVTGQTATGLPDPNQQEMMMLQMMMNPNGNNGNFNMMNMNPAMTNMDPSQMSTLMMNQMMQSMNMDLSGDRDKDR